MRVMASKNSTRVCKHCEYAAVEKKAGRYPYPKKWDAELMARTAETRDTEKLVEWFRNNECHEVTQKGDMIGALFEPLLRAGHDGVAEWLAIQDFSDASIGMTVHLTSVIGTKRDAEDESVVFERLRPYGPIISSFQYNLKVSVTQTAKHRGYDAIVQWLVRECGGEVTQ